MTLGTIACEAVPEVRSSTLWREMFKERVAEHLVLGSSHEASGRSKGKRKLVCFFWYATQPVCALGSMPSPASLTRARPEAFARVFIFGPKLPQHLGPPEISDFFYTLLEGCSNLAFLELNFINPRRSCTWHCSLERGKIPASILCPPSPAMTFPKKAAYVPTGWSVLSGLSPVWIGLISSWVVWSSHLPFAVPCGSWLFAFCRTQCLEASPFRTQWTWNGVEGVSPGILGKPDAKYWTVSCRKAVFSRSLWSRLPPNDQPYLLWSGFLFLVNGDWFLPVPDRVMFELIVFLPITLQGSGKKWTSGLSRSCLKEYTIEKKKSTLLKIFKYKPLVVSNLLGFGVAKG